MTDDFWRERAARFPADVVAAERRYERLYSAAARMLSAGGDRSGWPQERRSRWSKGEMLLTALPRTGLPGTADPAWQLASRPGPVSVADAVRDWRRRLRTNGGPVALPAVVEGLLRELAARLAPGRPAVTIGDAAAGLHALVLGLADDHRAAAGVTAGRSWPSLRGPLPLSHGRPLPAVTAQLETAAREAAAATPSPRELGFTGDAVAAADLLTGLYLPDGPGWREDPADLDPAEHMVSVHRWDGGVARPVGFAEHTAALRVALEDSKAPVPGGPAAAVVAELLDELAARLRPGRRVGTIRYTAGPLAELVRSVHRGV